MIRGDNICQLEQNITKNDKVILNKFRDYYEKIHTLVKLLQIIRCDLSITSSKVSPS
jgi:hypothetical protein